MSLPKAKIIPFPNIKRKLPKNEAEAQVLAEKVKQALIKEEEYLAKERQKQSYFGTGFLQIS